MNNSVDPHDIDRPDVDIYDPDGYVVGPPHAAFERLARDARAALGEIGYAGATAAEGSEEPTELEPGEVPLPRGQDEGDEIFHTYDNASRRALGAACRLAARLDRAAISPAHLMLGCLEMDGELEKSTGLTATRARIALAGRDGDDTPPDARTIGFAPELVELLTAMPSEAGASSPDTVAILGTLLRHGSPELRALLERQKLTEAFFERVRAGFEDPTPP